MSEGFLYHPAPNPRGGYTTRAVMGTQITEAELDTAVAAEVGLTPEQCALVLTTYLRHLLAAAANSRWSPLLYGLIGLFPRAGGSKPGPDDFHTPDDLQAGVRIAFSLDTLRHWRKTLHLVSQGLVGRVTPVVASIRTTTYRRPDVYVPGDLITVRGSHLKIDQDDPAQGIFFLQEDGTEVRCPAYAIITRLRFDALMPATLSGPIRLRVATYIHGSVRSTIHPIPLQQMPPREHG